MSIPSKNQESYLTLNSDCNYINKIFIIIEEGIENNIPILVSLKEENYDSDPEAREKSLIGLSRKSSIYDL